MYHWMFRTFQAKIALNFERYNTIWQECIPVRCVPAASWPYAAVCLPGGGAGRGAWSGGVPGPRGCLLGGAWFGGVVCLVRGVPGRGVCLVPGGCAWSRGGAWSGGGIPACTEADTLPPPPCGQNSWHTLVKILPWPNFVAAGKN